MDRLYSTVLYQDSPFLPNVTETSKTRVVTDIIIHRLPPIVAIAKELGITGADQNTIQEEEICWISETFGSTIFDIDDFLFGFSIVPILINGGYATMRFGFAEAIKLICQHTKDKYLINYNSYRSFYLLDAYSIIQSTLHRPPLMGATQIYQLCKEQAFLKNFYYLAGIEASEMFFTELSNFLDSC